MEVTARPGFQLFKTDPGYNDRAQPATRAVVNRQRRALSSRPLIRLRIAACGIAGGRRVTTHHNFIKALRDQGGAEVGRRQQGPTLEGVMVGAEASAALGKHRCFLSVVL